MTRAELFALAKKHGDNKKALRAEIAARLTQDALDRAPRIFDIPGGRKPTLDEAVAGLMEELGG